MVQNKTRASRLMKDVAALVVCWGLMFAVLALNFKGRGNHSSPRIPGVAAGKTVLMQHQVARQAAPSLITLPAHPPPTLSRNTSREAPPPLSPTLGTASRASSTETPSATLAATLRLSGNVCPPEAQVRQKGGGGSSRSAAGWTFARESEHEKVLLQARESRVQRLRSVRDFSMEPIRFVLRNNESIECDVGCETVPAKTKITNMFLPDRRRESARVDKYLMAHIMESATNFPAWK
ncbi:hypothetical protein T484DRAFT_1804485, partial [Baffinella frigidus]